MCAGMLHCLIMFCAAVMRCDHGTGGTVCRSNSGTLCRHFHDIIAEAAETTQQQHHYRITIIDRALAAVAAPARVVPGPAVATARCPAGAGDVPDSGR